MKKEKAISFAFYLGTLCKSMGFKKKLDGEFTLYWCIKKEADNLWNGYKSKDLLLYTTEEMFDKFENLINISKGIKLKK